MCNRRESTRAPAASLAASHRAAAETCRACRRTRIVPADRPGRTNPTRRPDRPQAKDCAIILAGSGALALGVIQLARSRVAGTAAEHLWAAYQASRALGTPGVVVTLAAIGAMQLARGR